MDQCADCGFNYDLSQSAAAGWSICERVAEVVTILHARDCNVRSRRQPDVWSPLEYGCHLRDMLLVQRERVLAARRMDRPNCPPSGRDERAVHDGYAEQEPKDVARQLADAAQMFSNVLVRLSADDWDRKLSTTTHKPANDHCGGSQHTPCMRHNTTCSTFAARSDQAA